MATGGGILRGPWQSQAAREKILCWGGDAADLDNLSDWSRRWGMEVHIPKWKVMHLDHQNHPQALYVMGGWDRYLHQQKKKKILMWQ